MGYILEVSILGKFFKMYTFLPPLYSRYYHFDILPSAFFFFFLYLKNLSTDLVDMNWAPTGIILC